MNNLCIETDVPGSELPPVPGCGAHLILKTFVNKDSKRDSVLVCPNCDDLGKWPKHKEKYVPVS